MIGPLFYAIRIAERIDGSTVYMSATVGGRSYKREFLGEAARFANREFAEMHLDASREIGPEIVALHSVKLAGDWRAWHATADGGREVLHGPEGEKVYKRSEGSTSQHRARFPWEANWPDGTPLADHHGRNRSFATPMAARKAIGVALKDAFDRHRPENRMKP